MKIQSTLIIAAILAGACNSPKDSSTTQTTSATTTAPDNTKANARDNQTGTMTPVDQGNDQADLDTTQAIRKAVMADDTLSSDAKNVKIITNHGVVTLRGPVKTLAERANVEAKATQAAGSNRVQDQIDVENK